MLDQEAQACLVYAHRPAACRTYGFFVRRADTLACSKVLDEITSRSAEHDVVWGNHERVEHELATSEKSDLNE